MSNSTGSLALLLRSQWERIAQWLTGLGPDLAGLTEQPSALEGWTVGELISHLGRAMDALAVCRPAEPGTVPLTLAEYLGTYPGRSHEIMVVTKGLDAEIAADRITGISGRARGAFERLAELKDVDVVQARRAPITLRDMIISRLIELVIHGDDLHRSLPGVVTDPVLAGALDVVAEEFLRIVTMREKVRLHIVDPRGWVRIAAGRAKVTDVHRVLAPEHASDAVPDLGRSLPIL